MFYEAGQQRALADLGLEKLAMPPEEQARLAAGYLVGGGTAPAMGALAPVSNVQAAMGQQGYQRLAKEIGEEAARKTMVGQLQQLYDYVPEARAQEILGPRLETLLQRPTKPGAQTAAGALNKLSPIAQKLRGLLRR
jgi:hypothetical protein